MSEQKISVNEPDELSAPSDGEKANADSNKKYIPLGLSDDRVTMTNPEDIGEMRSGNSVKPNESDLYDFFSDDSLPQIRRMSNSTRAREAEAMKKNRKKKKRTVSTNIPYEKDTPDGEYMFSPPKFKKKKRSRRKIIREAESPEGRKNITDIVPAPPRENTKKSGESAKTETEGVTEKKSAKRRIVDFNYYGDVEDVGLDITELKSILSSRVILLTCIFIFSFYVTVCNQFGLGIVGILDKNVNIYGFLGANLLTGILAMATSAPVISKGVKNLVKFRSDGDSMSALSAISCVIGNISAFFSPEMAMSDVIQVFTTVGIMSLLTNAVGKLLILRRADRNFDFVSENSGRYGVVYVKDEERAERLTRGAVGDFPILCAMKKTDFMTDFLKYTYSADLADSYCKSAVPLCLIVSVVVSCLLSFMRMGTLLSADSVAFGFSIYTMFISACSCIGLPFAVNVPLERVSAKTLRNGGIMLGYQSVDDLYDVNSVLIDAGKIFPDGSVSVSAVKIFSNIKTDEAMLEAASLAHTAGSIVYQIFSDVVADSLGTLYTVDNFSLEENGGFCGWINNKRVLLGGRELMSSHNIEGVPTKSKEAEYAASCQEVLYLSVSGNLAAMFIIDVKADRGVKNWIQKLSRNRVSVIIKSTDSFLTAKKISRLFYIPQEHVRIIPMKLHEDFDEETKDTVRLSASMACSGKFTSLAQLITGTKIIHSSAVAGLICQTVSIFIGLGISLLLILSKAFESDYIYMSSSAMILYQLICTFMTIVAVSLKKL